MWCRRGGLRRNGSHRDHESMDEIDHSQPYIVTVKHMLTPAECSELIARIESLSPEIATVNSADGPRVDRDVRNNDRVIFEDVALAQVFFHRVRSKAPQQIHGMVLAGANELLR